MFLSCCVKQAEDVKVLDFRHSGLNHVPNSVFNAERTLESLHIDANQIKSLPRELFLCHGLRQFTLSDNEITSIPPAIATLVNIEELDLSKNGILELPDNLKTLKYLQQLDVSVNPLGKLPDGFTQLLNLTEVHLNDCFLEYLPGNFGRLSKLRILELRENHLKTLPQSVSRLQELERLDIGCNEFTELPTVVGSLCNLLELWCDSNQITIVPQEIGHLKQLMYFDACKNRIGELPDEIDGCISLSDLHLSTNLLKHLPHSIGRLSNMTTLKVDDNQLLSLPSSIGGLVSLSELDVSANDLEELPPMIGLLRHLRTLIADENFLSDIPSELGSCTGLTVLSVRSNKLTYLPDEIGRIPRLRVLNLSDNEIKVLPYSLMNLKELQALWLAENQSKPLLRLQSEIDPETGRRSLTCYLLPQQRMEPIEALPDEDRTSFHASLWEEQRQQRQQIQFEDNQADHGTGAASYPKEQRVQSRHLQNQAVRQIGSGEVHGVDEAALADGEGGFLIGSVKSPSSPKNSTHRLLKLEKERVAKDKARINRHSQEVNPEDIETHQLPSDEALVKTERHGHDRFLLGRKDSTDNSCIIPHHLRNGVISRSHSAVSQSASVSSIKETLHGVTLTNANSVNNAPTSSIIPPVTHNALGDSLPAPLPSHADIYPATKPDTQINLSQTSLPNGSITPITGADSNTKISSGNNSTVAINQAEDHFGVFASEEDPKVYQRRFKYFQRMKKHRKSTDIHSDLGYYGKYANGSNKGSSDSGRRRPLLHGRDGFSNDPWETYANRSVGDGYASDVEVSKVYPVVPNHMHSSYRPVDLHKSLAERGSQNSVSTDHPQQMGSKTSIENRPPVPPNYDTAMASRTEIRDVENTPFPPPPPYKPPVRDMKPDGASNDGVPSLSPNNETRRSLHQHEKTTPVPFKSYNDLTTNQYSTSHDSMPNLQKKISPTSISRQTFYTSNSPHNSVKQEPARMNGYVRTIDRVYTSGGALHQVSNGEIPLREKQENFTNRSAQRQTKPPRLVTPVWHTLAHAGKHNQSPLYSQQSTPNLHRNGQQRVSYLSSVYQPKEPNDSEYMEQMSRSFNNLGYRKDTEGFQYERPHSYTLQKNGVSLQYEDSQSSRTSGNYASSGIYQTLPGHSTPTRTELYSSSQFEQEYQQHTAEQGSHGYRHQANYEAVVPRQRSANVPQRQLSNRSASYMPPPNRKSPRLPIRFHHIDDHPSPQSLHQETDSHLLTVTIIKNPGLGFSVAGGIGSQGNPFKPNDEGIFVTKVTPHGPATNILEPGDKIVRLNEHSLAQLEHSAAVALLKQSPPQVTLTIERMMPANV